MRSTNPTARTIRRGPGGGRLRRGRGGGSALAVLLVLVSAPSCDDDRPQEWRQSAGIAPTATEVPDALVQVYSARTYGWKGLFAVHSWIAFKEREAAQYEVYEVIGWKRRRGLVIRHRLGEPDRYWYGAEPTLHQQLRGSEAEQAIPAIREAIASYSYPDSYRAWPGPNSNTFVSHILRRVPALTVELPPHAIGKDWLQGGGVFDWTETGSGLQVSVLGILGLTVGVGDGLELNLLGLTIGIDLWTPALKLPLIGRVGFPDCPLWWK